MSRLTIVAVSILVVACAHRQAVPATPQPEPRVFVIAATPPSVAPPAPSVRDLFQVTLLSVAPLAQRGEFVAADSALASFAKNHPGSCEAAESGYVRALLRLSPGNTRAKAETAIPFLDSYLASSCVAPARAAEVILVRRVASDLMRQNFAGDSATSEEIRKLREQLDLARKELDRLKMRIIPPG
jgi:hypothetical protein